MKQIQPGTGCISMRSIIYIIVVILVISWLLGGFAFHVGGDAIHIIIVIAVILLLLNIFNGGGRMERGRWY
jgi:Family of unknown function (DUF5670)